MFAVNGTRKCSAGVFSLNELLICSWYEYDLEEIQMPQTGTHSFSALPKKMFGLLQDNYFWRPTNLEKKASQRGFQCKKKKKRRKNVHYPLRQSPETWLACLSWGVFGCWLTDLWRSVRACRGASLNASFRKFYDNCCFMRAVSIVKCTKTTRKQVLRTFNMEQSGAKLYPFINSSGRVPRIKPNSTQPPWSPAGRFGPLGSS